MKIYFYKMNEENIFITTTLPYSNGPIHVGAAFEFVLADALKIHFTNMGNNVFLNIGLDQNGSKILAKAKELNIPVEEYVKNMKNIWVESCKKLNINYDSFYETSSNEHAEKVREIWKILMNKGEIYEKEYTGKYCVGCETFKLDKDLIEGKCKDHPNTTISEINEKNYFFNLKKYKDDLLRWLEKNPLTPNTHNKELTSFINDYDEISISRKKSDTTFGIEVPNDVSQIIFIWLEALMNYNISADNWLGWNNCETIQLFGVDNNRFQSQIFQCLLSALNYKHSDKMLIHGTILDNEGRKMSKSLGNVVDPIEQLEKYGINAVRYYLLAGLNTFENSSWDEKLLVSLYNSEVVNEWGNLISRCLHLVDIKCNGELIDPDIDFCCKINNHFSKICFLWGDLKIKEALVKTNELVKFANKYINDEKPWNNDNYLQILSNLYWLIDMIGDLYKPVFPQINIDEIIYNKKKVILFEHL